MRIQMLARTPMRTRQAALLHKAFVEQRAFLTVVASSKDPKDANVVNGLVKNTAAAIGAVQEYREKNRAKKNVADHLAALSEGVPALGWVVVAQKPAPHVTAAKESAEFYTNRVLKEYKDKYVAGPRRGGLAAARCAAPDRRAVGRKRLGGVGAGTHTLRDETQKNWARAFPALLTALFEYVKKYHTTGLAWNPKGGDAKSAAPADPSVPAASKPEIISISEEIPATDPAEPTIISASWISPADQLGVQHLSGPGFVPGPVG